jgi:hypothetical protein
MIQYLRSDKGYLEQSEIANRKCAIITSRCQHTASQPNQNQGSAKRGHYIKYETCKDF